ncbi:MAG: zinc-dependent alcohol dehydrogenase family protein [Hyphomicrobiaceae bacterium]
MTKVARLMRIEGPQALQIVDEEIPTPGAGEVLVRNQTMGLNRAEHMYMNNVYLATPPVPALVGVESAGVIEAIGEGVTGFTVGQEVCVTPNLEMDKYGVIAEHAVVPASVLIEKPANLSWDEASSVWMAYPTAYGGLVFSGGLKKGAGQVVLISAASSSVGQPAIQIAKEFGATVIATSRTLEKAGPFREAGADHVVATSDENWPEKVMELTGGKGFDIAFDPISGPFTAQLAEAAAPDATVVTYGVLAMADTPLPIFPMLLKRVKFVGFHIIFHMWAVPDRWEEAKTHILPKLKDGTYKPLIAKAFSLDEVADAYAFMEAGTQQGKIVLRA